MPLVSKYRQLARQRVETAWNCVGVLCPSLTLQAKKVLAQRVLDPCRGEEQTVARIQITPAQVQEVVWRNMQCINPHCPMVLFSREIAEELNEFFKQEE
jgi:hypothetical protein